MEDKKPYNPVVGTTYLELYFKKQFDKLSDKEICQYEKNILGGRSLRELINIKADTPISDVLLVMVVLDSARSREDRPPLLWSAAGYMKMRYDTDNHDVKAGQALVEEAKNAFIESIAPREATESELRSFRGTTRPNPEPDWMKNIPLY